MIEKLELEVPGEGSLRQEERERWLEARKGTLGGSGAAVAVGMGRHGSRMRLWAEMTGKVPPEDISRKEYVYWGNALEGTVVEELGRRTKFRPTDWNESPDPPWRGFMEDAEHMGAFDIKADARDRYQHLYRSKARHWQTLSPDAFCNHPEHGLGLVEAKTVGVRSSPDWRDSPPEWVQLQIAHGLAVTGLPYGVIVALVGGQQLLAYMVERDDELIELLNEREADFMELVETKVPPETDDHPDTLATVKELYPTGNKRRVVLPESALHWDEVLQQAKADARVAETLVKGLEARMRAMIGEYEYAEIPGGEFEYTLRTQTRPERITEAYSYRELRRRKRRKPRK